MIAYKQAEEKEKSSKTKIVFVGTYPPTQEGISTFNYDLISSIDVLARDRLQLSVCAVDLKNTSPYYFDRRVEWEIDQTSLATYIQAAKMINNDPSVECVIIQHEYGIYGGMWGKYLTIFMEILKAPVITILHTVLESHPIKSQIFEAVTREILENSNAVVVLSKKSLELIQEKYKNLLVFGGVGKKLLRFIEHGIHPVEFILPLQTKSELRLEGKTVLTTFGLLSPNKGIEYLINALPLVVRNNPRVIYQLLGQTHPVVRKREGERYRMRLLDLVKKLKIKNHVFFRDEFLHKDELIKSLLATDLYIATSLNENQSVSGTLSFALGAGRAVISTEFIQSKEIVGKNTGVLVPIKDSDAFAGAINKVLKDPQKLYKMHRNAYIQTRSMLWTNIAYKYLELVENLIQKNIILPEIDLRYFRKMTNKAMLQFAVYDIPDKNSGYTLDDNARALIVTSWIIESYYKNTTVHRMLLKHLNFIEISLSGNSGHVNYFDHNFSPTSQNQNEDIEESLGRAVWALSEVFLNKKLSAVVKNMAKRLLKKILTEAFMVTNIRSKAFVIKAYSKLWPAGIDGGYDVNYEKFANDLLEALRSHKKRNWNWFEDKLTYNNGILPEALFHAYKTTGKKDFLKAARISLAFLVRKTFMGGVYVPIGQKGWLVRGRKRNFYDQQPEDVGSMVLALLTAYEVTGQEKYRLFAKQAFSFFLGNNLKGIPLYNYKTGGVHDALTPLGVNKNQGAEALVSYLLARIKIERYW